MSISTPIILASAAAAGAGIWAALRLRERLVARVVGRALGPIDARSLGFHAQPAGIQLANAVGAAFRTGALARLAGGRSDAWIDTCECLDPFARPFAYEGAAFGHAALTLAGRTRWPRLADDLVARRPQYVYLFHVGIGFWAAFRYADRFAAWAAALNHYDPVYRFLCADGYGFKFGFFDYLRNPRAADPLTKLPGYYRHAAFQGLGRALYFAFMDDRRGLFAAASRFAPDYDRDIISGVGLAVAFAHTQEPARAAELARAVPTEWRPALHLGLTFGYQARRVCEPVFLDSCLRGLAPPAVAAVRRALEHCGVFEQRVRGDGRPDAYRRWREDLAAHMEREGTWEPLYHGQRDYSTPTRAS